MDKTPPVRDPKDVAANKDLAALGYVWVLSLVVLFARRDSAFVQFHARQGAVLFGLSLVVWAMPFVGKLAELLVLALCAIGFLHAAQGQWKDLPIIGPLARGSIVDLRDSWKDVVTACASLWKRVRPEKTPDAATHEQHPAQSAPLPVIDVETHAAPMPASVPTSADRPVTPVDDARVEDPAEVTVEQAIDSAAAMHDLPPSEATTSSAT